ncbi:hypothetical protein C2G38_2055821 [Gigaspora rosea]|uniref:Uncharacterized protein n=1 Tax=Gigaspora rosea TaxID=44941 RepID=A0A397W888_9GLOM|nr:hypothetical protein C2G38_2055821 [Gigaspora rosea]
MKTDDIPIKNHLKEIIKFRLEFLDLAEKSVDHYTKLLGYIANSKAVIALIDDKTIREENIIEELKSLSYETKEYETILQAFSEQILNIIKEFLKINDDLKPHIDNIKLKEAKKKRIDLPSLMKSKSFQILLYHLLNLNYFGMNKERHFLESF